MTYSFKEEYGFEPPRMVGKQMAVIVHKHIMAGTQTLADSTLHIPDEIIEKQKWSSIVGRVVALGSACFKGDFFEYWDDVPKIGDWIVFKANPGPLLEFRGIDMIFMFDESTKGIIEDPNHVTRD